MVDLLLAATSGIGVYSVAEAACYARMPVATLNAWFFGHQKRAPMRASGIAVDDTRAITFVDFVEALAIRALRVDHKISLQKVREAIGTARDRYGIDHPFARRDHRTVLVGKELHIFLKEDAANPVGLTGRDAGQKSFTPCIEAYMQDLDFDEHGLARLYTAFVYENQKVVMNPKINFGEPMMMENGISAETLWRAAVAEGGFERAAEIYEVKVEAVRAAYRYCNGELGMAA